MDKIEKKYSIDHVGRMLADRLESIDYNSIIANFGGMIFEDGLYRIFDNDMALRLGESILPNFEYLGQIRLFGCDWLGRLFGEFCNGNEVSVLLFSYHSMDVYKIPCDISTFHNDVLSDQASQGLEIELWKTWINSNRSRPLSAGECVSLKQYLFIGGELAMSNLDLSNIEVDWDIAMQMFRSVNGIDDGDPVYVIN